MEVLGMEVAHGKPLAVREDGWEAWLHRHRLWDPSAPATCMHMHYLKLSCIKFTAVHESEWWQLYHDLLPMEKALACGEVIGYVDCPFWFNIKDECPICMKAAALLPSKRSWLCKHMNK